MSVNSLQISGKTEEPAAEPPHSGRRLFQKGQSGNPAGRKRGSKNKSTLAAQILLEGEAETLTRKAVELAIAGNALALKLCLDRIYPAPRDRAVPFEMPPIDNAIDLAAAMKAVAAATASGELSAGEALDLARVADSFLRVIDARDFEIVRRKRMERAAAERAAAAQHPGMNLREHLEARLRGR